MPYPNVSQSMTLDKGTSTVKADGGMMIAIKGSEFALSNGDNAGVAGGVKSSTFMKESTWILYSFDVKMDGQNACRLADKMFMNHENTACLSGHFIKPTNLSPADSKLWDDCEKQHDRYKATQAEQAAMAGLPAGNSLQDRIDYCDRLEKRIKVVERLHRERKTYIDMGCDKFDWSNAGTTQAEREKAHRDELSNVTASLKNLRELLTRFRP